MQKSILIRQARVLDGTGAPWFESDVLIQDGRIAAIGRGLAVTGAQVVHAAGQYLAPGFIDVHTHDEFAQLRDPARPEKVYQGITTVVTGNCGFSLFPAQPGTEDAVQELNASLHGPIDADEILPDCARFRERLAEAPAAINTVAQVGHGTLRATVMGFTDREASPAEMAQMTDLLHMQIRQGACGLSLGLMYSPSMYAPRAELVALARVVAQCDALLTVHLRDYSSRLLESLDEFLSIVAEAGCKALVSHLQVTGRNNWGAMPVALARLETARRQGIDVSFDMYPYLAGSTSILQLLPAHWQSDGAEGILRRLADPQQCAMLRDWLEQPANDLSKVTQIGWGSIWIGDAASPEFPDAPGRSLRDLATLRGTHDPFPLFVSLIRASQGQASVILFQQEEKDLNLALGHRLHMVGSDSIPRCQGHVHPRIYGSFPRFVRKALDGRDGALEDGIRRITALPAQRFGLWERGIIRTGAIADLVLFSQAVADRATFELPRLFPQGIDSVWVAGEAILQAGEPTGKYPGRLLFSPHPHPHSTQGAL
ncbi:MAG: N-acyl-D-amino-acid deacylase [Proteobacteria bacterium]|nr:N-acyl-D-amino-acid deacylase [Pseudomonadota bacterium]